MFQYNTYNAAKGKVSTPKHIHNNLDAGSASPNLFGDEAARGREEIKRAVKRPANWQAAPAESAAYARKARAINAKAVADQQTFRRSSNRATKRTTETNKSIVDWST